MSRYPGPDYPRERRDRSPPRFPDRRPPAYNDPPRAPRSRELRDAPPLGRVIRDPRDFNPPPRELEPPRQRRDSRDGPIGSGSAYSDGPPPFRGGFGGRGRGRGDLEFRPGRGGRRHPDDREVFRRERSPPPRWTRSSSRDGREPDRRDERRFDRRDDNRRPDWIDRERDIDRARLRDQPPPRMDSRPIDDPMTGGAGGPSLAPHVNPDRLALIDVGGVDSRKPSSIASLQSSALREPRRDQPEIPSYLNARAETTSNRYSSRGSSPPTQAPPVPAFTLSFAPPSQSGSFAQPAKATSDPKPAGQVSGQSPSAVDPAQRSSHGDVTMSDAPIPTAPRADAQPQKSQAPEPPLAAPRAPRALENESIHAPVHRLQGVRSWETLAPSLSTPSSTQRGDSVGSAMSSNPQPRMVSLTQPLSPTLQQTTRQGEFAAPTGPKASRSLQAQSSLSPHPTFASPNSENASTPRPTFHPRSQTPPPSAPSGPRNRAVSASPKAPFSTVPTAPKADRLPPSAPMRTERGLGLPRGPEWPSAPGSKLPPTAPRAQQQQWNQWRRPGPQAPVDKVVPVKRDSAGEEKYRSSGLPSSSVTDFRQGSQEDYRSFEPGAVDVKFDRTDIEPAPPTSKPGSATAGHSAQQSFFGKPVEEVGDEPDFSDAADESMSTSEEEEIEMEDLTLFEAKYDRQKRELEARLIDLSSRDYRATTPLEFIARLARVSVRDLERFKERGPEMDIDEPQSVNDHLIPPATHSSESDDPQDLLTPKGEDNTSVLIHDADNTAEVVRHVRRPTPEVITLPYLTKTPQMPLDQSIEMQESLANQEETADAVMSMVEDDFLEQQAQVDGLEAHFEHLYRRWREECEDLDREREQQETLERQLSQEPGPEPETLTAIPINPILEGRRLHKFSSEYEIEQVLKQSEETARIEQEKADREAKKVQADMEKEAVVPDQIPEHKLRRRLFIDNNRLRDPETLTVVFAYEPAPDDFTGQEQQIFIAAFRDTPKKWSEIASLLPGREPKDCIRHYYTNKWDGRFRDNRTRKLKAGRRGRGGKAPPRGKGSAAMADMARAEDVVQTVNVSDSGRPKRAAAPTTFGERELDAKTALLGQSPAKKLGANSRQDAQGDTSSEKPVKRRKGMGEKPGRKPKNSQNLAQLAAAPTLSPDNRALQHPQARDDMARSQALEDASLLAGLHSSRPGIHIEPHTIYMPEGFMPHRPPEDLERLKPPPSTQPTKASPSSYWSVPEQSDFVKYIGHFGTDFGAIAAHMGTKTQTMIKNHYQRQVDAGNRPELEEAAMTANARRDRGEDMGAPPTPTPITKRKYDNPQSSVPRTLAPHADPMEIDDSSASARATASKQASPAQYHMQPRHSASAAQVTPTPAQRVAPNSTPLPDTAAAAAAAAAAQLSTSATSRPFQPSFGSRMSVFPDSRPESRPGMQSTSTFRTSQHGTPTVQPAQPSRSVQEAQDPQFIRSLMEEQARAIRIQGHYHEQDRLEQVYQRGSLQQQQQQMQQSPAMQQAQIHADRKPGIDERANTPPLSYFAPNPPSGSSARPPLEAPGTFAYDHMRFSTRQSMIPSPPKREEPRPGPISAAPPSGLPHIIEARKVSNILSILNSDSEEPKVPKRGSLDHVSPAVIPRNLSPVQHGVTSAMSPFGGASHSRLEGFNQSALGQHQFQRPTIPASAPSPAPSVLKQEPIATGVGGIPSNVPPKQDWTGRISRQGARTPPSNAPPPFEREVRPYYSHRSSMLGQLNGPTRGNPSPPPHPVIQHSRTPSLSTQGPTQPPPGEPRQYIPGQQQQTSSSAVPMQTHPYSQPPNPPYSQAPPSMQVQSHAHHPHSGPMASAFPPMHQRGMSRDDQLRQDQPFSQRERERDRERERERERERRHRQEEQEAERRRAEAQQLAQRQHEQERHYSRGPPPSHQAMHPPYGSSYEQGPPRLSTIGMREQSMREAEVAMQQAQYREREREQQEDARRRHDEAYGARMTPLGGGFGAPSMQGPGRR